MLRASVGTTLLTTTALTCPGDRSRCPEQIDDLEPELVAGEAVIGVDPEVCDELLAVEDPDDDVRVPDVDREQHGGECRHHRPVIALLDIGGTKIAASAGRGASDRGGAADPDARRLPARARCADWSKA